jgi:hypothetical protein
MADKAKGWLRKKKRAAGMTWLWCHQKLRPSDGKMAENSIPTWLGLRDRQQGIIFSDEGRLA